MKKAEIQETGNRKRKYNSINEKVAEELGNLLSKQFKEIDQQELQSDIKEVSKKC